MNLFRIDEKDSVAVALKTIEAGETNKVGDVEVTANEEIKTGHKIALKNIAAGEPVIKYGCMIGEAAQKYRKVIGCIPIISSAMPMMQEAIPIILTKMKS